jgi:hypothetical protein
MRIGCLSIILFAAIHAAYGAEAQGINNSPDVLRLIRTAETIYVFPVTSPLKPQRDDRHMRLLDPEARHGIVQLLGNDASWWHGLSAIAIPEKQATNIGLLFRSGKEELVLFFNSETVEGKFREIELGGLLERKPKEEFEAWKRQYAQPELAFK